MSSGHAAIAPRPLPWQTGRSVKLLTFERRWLLSVFDAIMPANASRQLPWGAKDLPLDRFVDDLTRIAPKQFRLGLRATIWLIALSPWFVLRRATTVVGLSQAERVALLDRLSQSESYVVRELPLMLKMVVGLGYCGLPETQDAFRVVPRDSAPADWVGDGAPMRVTPNEPDGPDGPDGPKPNNPDKPQDVDAGVAA